jgi:undecaprenyl diphosphate synthase
MDGNGRWAQKRGLPRIEGHARGIDVVRNIVRECSRLGVQQLTLYCLSSENWKRPRQELDFLMELLQTYLIQERPELLQQNIRFSTIGRMGMLPDEVQMQIQETMNICRDNTGMGLSLAINYGSRQEMVDAVKKIANQVTQGSLSPDQIDESVIASSLYTNGMPDPDLLIRTAGEMRISNFLLWQISYAEIWVTSKEWPDFTVSTLHEAIGSYSQRNRKFGGLKG